MVSNGAGVNQSCNSNFAPGAKKMENCPPSGPSQKRSSPPKAFMCGCSLPDAINSRLIQPKLAPPGPSAVLVSTRPCHAGATATCAVFDGSCNTTTSVCFCKKAKSSPKLAADTGWFVIRLTTVESNKKPALGEYSLIFIGSKLILIQGSAKSTRKNVKESVRCLTPTPVWQVVDEALLQPRPAFFVTAGQDGGQLVNLRSGFTADAFQF